MENIHTDIYIDPVQTNLFRSLFDDLIVRFRQLESPDGSSLLSSSSTSSTSLTSSSKSPHQRTTTGSSSSSSSSLSTSTNVSKRILSSITSSKGLYAEVLRLVLRDMCSVPIKVQLPESLNNDDHEQQRSTTTVTTTMMKDNGEKEDEEDENNLYVDITEDWESEAIDKGWSKAEVRNSSSSTRDGSPSRQRVRKDNSNNQSQNHGGTPSGTTTVTTRSSSPERSVFSSEQQKSSHHYIRKLATELTNTTAVLKDYIPTVENPVESFTKELGFIMVLVQKVSQDNLLSSIEKDMSIIRQAKNELIRKSQISIDPSSSSSSSVVLTTMNTTTAVTFGSKRSIDGNQVSSTGSSSTTISSSTPTKTMTTTTSTTPQSSGRFGISALFPALGRSPSRSASTNRTTTTPVTSHTVLSSPHRSSHTMTKPLVPFIADTSFEQHFTNASDLLRNLCSTTVHLVQRWPRILLTLQQICEIFIQLSETYLQKSEHCTERYNAVSTMLQEAMVEKTKIDNRLINAVTLAKLNSGKNGNEQLSLMEALSTCLDFIMVHNNKHSSLSTAQTNYTDKQVKEFMDITTERTNLLTQIETLTTDQKNCQSQKMVFSALSDLVLCAREYAVISCIRAQISLQRALMETLFCTDSVTIEWLVSLLEWSGSEEKKRLLAENEIEDKQTKLQNHLQYFGNTAPQSQADTLAQIAEMEQVIRNSETSVSHVLSVCMDIGKYSLANLPLELRQTILQRFQVLVSSTDLSKAFDIDIFSNRLRTSAANATANLANEGNSSTVSTPSSLSSFMDNNVVHKGAFKLRSYSSVRHMHLRTLLIPYNENIIWGSALLAFEKTENSTHISSSSSSNTSNLSEGQRSKCLLFARTGLKPLMPIISQPSIHNLRSQHNHETSIVSQGSSNTDLPPTYGTLFDTLSIMAPGPPLPEIETIDEEMNNSNSSSTSTSKRDRDSTRNDKAVSSGNKRARRDNDDDEDDNDSEGNDDDDDENEYDYRRKSGRHDTSGLSSTTTPHSGQKRARPYGGDGPGSKGNSNTTTPTTNGRSKYLRASNTQDDNNNDDDDGNETDGTVDSEASESGACIIM